MSKKAVSKDGAKKERVDETELVVLTGEAGTRGWGATTRLKVKDLSAQINAFLEQMGSMLEKTPHKLGEFRFEEFEVQAEITATGSLALLGTGGQVGASGGIKFVFRRSSGLTSGTLV